MLFLNQDKKMMTLMSLLYQNDGDWHQYTDLSHELKVSRKTIKSYLENLEAVFQDHAHFRYTNSMVHVQFDPNFGLLTMQRTFLQNTLIVQILQQAFFTPNMNKLDLSLALNCSESSIFRNIQQFNELLTDIFELEFSYARFQFIGSEREIRKFYINFFIEILPDPTIWPFEDFISEEEIKSLCNIITEYLHKHHLNPVLVKYLRVGLAVSLVRLKQGFTLTTENPHPTVFQTIETILQAPEVRDLLGRHFPDSEEPPSKWLYQILAYFLSDEFFLFLTNPPIQEKEEKEEQECYAYYKESLAYLQKKYRVTIPSHDEFYKIFLTHFKFKLSHMDASGFFVNYSDHFLDYVKKFNVSFYNDVHALLKECLCIFYPHAAHRYKELAYTVYTLWPNLLPQLINHLPPYRALIISHYDHYYAKTLMEMLNSINQKVLIADVYEGCDITLEAIEQAPHEVIISDFVLKQKPKNKLVFSFEQLPPSDKIQKLLLTVNHHRTQRILSNHSEKNYAH